MRKISLNLTSSLPFVLAALFLAALIVPAFHSRAEAAVETVEVITPTATLSVELMKVYNSAVHNFADFEETDAVKINRLEAIPIMSGGIFVRYFMPGANLARIVIENLDDGKTVEVYTKYRDYYFMEVENAPKNYNITVTGLNIARKRKSRPATIPRAHRSFSRPSKEGEPMVVFYIDGSDNINTSVVRYTEKIKGNYYTLVQDGMHIAAPTAAAQAKFDEMLAYDIKTFGPISDVDGDGKLALVFMDIVSSRPNFTIFGYFWGHNSKDSYEMTKNGGNWGSNHADVIYLNNEVTFSKNNVAGTTEVDLLWLANLDIPYGTFAHELQHLIHHKADANEKSWINEGMSVLAEDLNYVFGVPVRITEAFAKFPGQRLNFQTNALDDSMYGLSYLFCRYVFEKRGSFPKVVSIVQNSAAQDIDPCDADPIKLAMDFSTCMILNDKTVAAYGFDSDTIPATFKCDSEEIIYNPPPPPAPGAAATFPVEVRSADVFRLSAKYFTVRPDRAVDPKITSPSARVSINYQNAEAGPAFEGRVALFDETGKYTVEEIKTAPLSTPLANGSNYYGEFVVKDYGTKVKKVVVNCTNIIKRFDSEGDFEDAEIVVGPPDRIFITAPENRAFVGGKNNPVKAKIDFDANQSKLIAKVVFMARENVFAPGFAGYSDLAAAGFRPIGEKTVAESEKEPEIVWDVTPDEYVHDKWYELVAVGFDKENKEVSRSCTNNGQGVVYVRMDKKCDLGISSPINGQSFQGEAASMDIDVSGWVEGEAKSASLNGSAIALSKDWTNFSVKSSISDGSTTFTLRGVDRFDNEGEFSVTVHYKKIEKPKEENKPKPEDVKHGDPTFIQIDREDE